MLFHLFDSIAQDTYEKGIAKLVIHLFGCTAEGQPIHITVNGFEPFFYVRLPEVPGKSETSILADFKKRVGSIFQSKINEIENENASIAHPQYHRSTYQYDRQINTVNNVNFCRKKLMYGYTGEKDFPFAEIRVKSKKEYYEMRKIFLDERTRPIFKLYKDSEVLKVYDATLDPMLRFFHIQNLQPCGWVEADIDLDSDGNGECDWEDVTPFKGIPPSPTAPLLMNFWDIECYSESGEFPIAENNDPVIQIGNVLVRGTTIEKHIFVLGTCDPVEGAIVHTYKTEKNMLLAWANFMSERNPDVYVGYNIFGFDEKYLWQRAEILGITEYDCFQAMNRLRATDETGKETTKLETKFLSSSALGDNYLYMWTTKGRLQIDLYHYVRRLTALPSYKLDAVCQNFMSGKCSAVDTSTAGFWKIKTKGTSDVRVGRYLTLLDETGEPTVEKLRVVSIEDGKSITVEVTEHDIYEDDAEKWAIVKDDVSPAEIFEFHKDGGSEGRSKVAAYCIQDCDLVYELYKKLDVFNNAMSMANVCSVPVNYIFTRGQGIKIESLIFKECYELGMVVEVLDSPSRDPNAEDEEGLDSYEGAIVLDPVPGFYSESPIGVCDFASLYPSSIISENISHDSLVWVKDFPLEGGKPIVSWGNEADERYAPPGTRWTDIEFDILRPDPQDTRVNPTKIKMGVRVCRYAQKPDGSKHTLPNIVAKLLAARKSKRKEAEKENDPFRKALLDAEQLAYKLTANSLYGQLGSSTFKIRLQNLAASVTAYGRKQILFAKEAIEQFYGPAAKVIYGDTDSLFVDFGMTGEDAIQKTMDITEEAGKFVSSCLKAPHDFEYDKVFDRFIIFSKKRYVGNKYEDSATDFKQTSMGIVLKRRDNAPILKTIYGGAIKILLNEKDVPKAVDFVRTKTLEMVEGKMSMSQLTITKSLSANYKSTPAHKILADRIKERDPGNAPTAGERMGFIYVAAKAGEVAAKLQGDRIETPDFIRKNGLRPDYEYYIERQLMKPIGQLFGIMVEKIPGFQMPLKGLEESKRDSIAIELLFRKALEACGKAAKREFMTKQFGITLPVALNTETILVKHAPSISLPQPKKTQGKIDTYFLHKKIAQEYKEIKKTKAKATALKEQVKDSNGTTKKGGSD
jgi:DNA polymerase elongation subunit (family B)